MFESNHGFLQLSAIIDMMLLFQRAQQTIFLDSILVKLDMMSQHHWKCRAERAPVKSTACLSPCRMLTDSSGYRIDSTSLKNYKLKNLSVFFFFHIYPRFCILWLTFLLKGFLLSKLVFSINLNPIFLIISLPENKKKFPSIWEALFYIFYANITSIPLPLQII